MSNQQFCWMMWAIFLCGGHSAENAISAIMLHLASVAFMVSALFLRKKPSLKIKAYEPVTSTKTDGF